MKTNIQKSPQLIVGGVTIVIFVFVKYSFRTHAKACLGEGRAEIAWGKLNYIGLFLFVQIPKLVGYSLSLNFDKDIRKTDDILMLKSFWEISKMGKELWEHMISNFLWHLFIGTVYNVYSYIYDVEYQHYMTEVWLYYVWTIILKKNYVWTI